MLINTADFPSVEAALNIAEDGDRVYIPGIVEYTAPSGGWLITRSIEIYGDGPGTPRAAGGTVLHGLNAGDPIFKIIPPVENVYLHDMELRGVGGTGAGVGILCQSTVTNPTLTRGLRLKGLAISNCPSHGIRIDGYNDSTAKVAGVSVMDCLVEQCGGVGLLLNHAYDAYVAGCLLRENQMNGLAATASGVGLYQCVFDANALLASWSRAANPTEGNLKLVDCVMANVDSCQFLNFHQGQVRTGCVIVNPAAASVAACYLETDGTGEPHGIWITGGGGPAVVLSNRYSNVTKLVIVDSGVKDCVVLPQGEVTSVGSMDLPQPNQGMFGGAAIQQAAGYQLTGMIVPSGASDPATAESREGMLFYNTTGQALRVYFGGFWRTVDVA